jgi:hypothetical protein
MANSFFLVLSFYHLIVFIKKIHYNMQCEKLYNLQRTVYFIHAAFGFESKRNYVRQIFNAAKR